MSSIPGKQKIVASSIIFVVASVLLLWQFLLLHGVVSGSGAAIDWSGGLSCVCWFAGFSLLIDWIVFDTFPAWGASRRPLIGATLKLIASAFFCVQPFSDMSGYLNAVPSPNATSTSSSARFISSATTYPRANGVPWSNFVGILFFHLGNCVDAVGMAPLLNLARLHGYANWPVLGMFCYCAATWLLAIAGGIGYAETPFPWGAGGTLSTGESAFVAPAQIIGALMLLLGSIVYTAWSAELGGKATAVDALLTNAVPADAPHGS